MNNTVTTAKPAKNVNRLDQREYYRLYRWLEDHIKSFQPGVTRGFIAVQASSDLGFTCTGWHIKGALETCGLELPGVPSQRANEEKIRILAKYLVEVWAKHWPQVPIPPELKDLL